MVSTIEDAWSVYLESEKDTSKNDILTSLS